MAQFNNWLEILKLSKEIMEDRSDEGQSAARDIASIALREVRRAMDRSTMNGREIPRDAETERRAERLHDAMEEGLPLSLDETEPLKPQVRYRRPRAEEPSVEGSPKQLREIKETPVQAPQRPRSGAKPMRPTDVQIPEAEVILMDDGMDETTPIRREAAPTPVKVEETQVDFLPFDEFEFTYHYTRYKDARGEKQAEIIAFPVSRDEGSKRFLVWSGLGSGGNTTHATRICDDPRGTTVVRIDDVDYIVSGEVDNGKFASGIRLTDKETRDGLKREFTTIQHGANKHILIMDEGIRIDCVPYSDKNQRNGNAAYIYCIQIDGEEPIHGDTVGKESVEFRWNGKLYALRCRMKDRVCYARVDLVRGR